jgi:hypothetical protein
MNARIVTKDRRRLFAVVYVVVLLLLCAVFFHPGQGSLTVRFVGLTNFPGQTHPTALFAVTNHSAEALEIAHLVEIKAADWPSRDTPTTWIALPAVGAHQVSTVSIDVPNGGSAWRLCVAYSEGSSMCDRSRSAVASFLHAHNLKSVAALLWPRMRIREIRTAEMKI